MRALALVVLLCGGTAMAQVYIRTHVSGSDICLYWAVREYRYAYDAAGYSKYATSGHQEFLAMDAAFASWKSLSSTCSNFNYVRDPNRSDITVGYDRTNTNNYNVLTFRELNCDQPGLIPADDPCWDAQTCSNVYKCWSHGDGTIALTTTTHQVKTGIIVDADVEFNASPGSGGSDPFLFTTVNSPPCDPGTISTSCVATDVQNTLTHELGHVIGLDHVTVPGATMEATAPLGETRKRIIDAGTALGFCTIYPAGAFSTSNCDDSVQTSLKIVAINRGTPLSCSSSVTGADPSVWLAALGLWAARRRKSG